MAIRTFSWGDIPALVQLENESRLTQGNPTTTSSVLNERMRSPGLSPESNCLIYESGESISGCGLILHEPVIQRAVLELIVHPKQNHDLIEKDLIRSALKRSRELQVKVLHVRVPKNSTTGSTLKRLGFKIARVYWTMHWNSSFLADPYIPKGYSLRTYSSKDLFALTELQNAIFEGSWGFCPNTPEQLQYRVSMSISNDSGIILLDHHKKSVGYCWTLIDGIDNQSTGIISMIGIHPDYRNQRLGPPILLTGLRYLSSQNVDNVELSVDSKNIPAIRMYQSNGFAVSQEDDWFEASIHPDPPIPNGEL